MRIHYQVQLRDAMSLQERDDPGAHVRLTAVDQYAMAVELDELTIALANIDKINGKITRLVRTCKRNKTKTQK